ncbi:MAG: 16S rRNA (guanine(527)-N(7))-methyltransferase RsmG [Panacagrimonas sp.]
MIADRLQQGLAQLGLDAALHAPLLTYVQELEKWNAAYNLTAVRDPLEMVTRHLLDSLAVLPALRALPRPLRRLIDVGSGAGLPGIPLALACPEWQVDLLDSNGKKARFLRHAVRSLGLHNAQVLEMRAEDCDPDPPYDGVISRAFSALGAFVGSTAQLLTPQGYWLAMKGRVDENESAELSSHARIDQIVSLAVPGLPEQRHLVIASLLTPHPSRI